MLLLCANIYYAAKFVNNKFLRKLISSKATCSPHSQSRFDIMAVNPRYIPHVTTGCWTDGWEMMLHSALEDTATMHYWLYALTRWYTPHATKHAIFRYSCRKRHSVSQQWYACQPPPPTEPPPELAITASIVILYFAFVLCKCRDTHVLYSYHEQVYNTYVYFLNYITEHFEKIKWSPYCSYSPLAIWFNYFVLEEPVAHYHTNIFYALMQKNIIHSFHLIVLLAEKCMVDVLVKNCTGTTTPCLRIRVETLFRTVIFH